MSGAKEVLHKVAAIAHSGGLIGGLDPQDALAAIRRLSLSYWLKEHNPEQVRATLTQQPAAVDEFAEDRNRLLRAFMQECGVIGPEKAGVNLARGIKAALAAQKGGRDDG